MPDAKVLQSVVRRLTAKHLSASADILASFGVDALRAAAPTTPPPLIRRHWETHGAAVLARGQRNDGNAIDCDDVLR